MRKKNLKSIVVLLIIMLCMNTFSINGRAATDKYIVTGSKIMYVDDCSRLCFYKDANDGTEGIIESGVKWKVSNSKIASVNKEGIIIAKKTGKTTVTGSYKGHKASIKITIKKKQLNFKDLYIPLNRSDSLTVLGGDTIIKSITTSNQECLEIQDAVGSAYVEVVGKKLGTTKVKLITEGDNKEYTANVTVIDPLELTITNVNRRTVKGMAVLDFTLRNDSNHTISTCNKIGAFGDVYGFSVCSLESNAVIEPGKMKKLTILSDLAVKDFGKDVLKDMAIGLNVKYQGHDYGMWFDNKNEKISDVFMGGFVMSDMYN